MSHDPSLLPEDMRKQEEDLQLKRGKNGNGRGGLHIPSLGAGRKQQQPTPPPIDVQQPTGGTPQSSNGKQHVPPSSPPPPPPLPRGGESRRPVSATTPALPSPASPSSPASPDRAVAPAMHVPDEPAIRDGATVLPNLHLPRLRKRVLKSVSLIPEELRKGPVSPWWPQIIAGLGIALVIPIIGIPWWMLSSRVADARARTEAAEATYTELLGAINEEERQVERYRSTADRANVLGQLLATHGTWEGLFALIEAYTLPGVQYERLSADTSGALSLPTLAPNLRTAAIQLSAWGGASHVASSTTSGFSSVLDEIGAARGTRFDLQLQVDPALFTMDPAAIKAPYTQEEKEAPTERGGEEEKKI